MDNQLFTMINQKLESIDTAISNVGRDVSDMKSEFGKDISDMKADIKAHKGFISGVTFVFATLWTGVTFFWDKIAKGFQS